MMKTKARSMRLWFGMLAAILLIGTVQAWQPAGWVYMDWPWAYDSTSGDWHWFSADGTQWVVNMHTSQWSLFGQEAAVGV